jgi:hypothetical protein
MVAALMVAAYGLHHFVNGWCNYHWQWQPSLLRVGCTCCCPIMKISQQSPPLTFMWGNCPLASLAQACNSQLFQAYHSESVFGQVYRYLPHLSITRVTKAHLFSHKKDHFNQMVCHITSEECYRLSLEQHSPSNVSTMLGPEWFIKPHTKAYNISEEDDHFTQTQLPDLLLHLQLLPLQPFTFSLSLSSTLTISLTLFCSLAAYL